MDGWLDEEASQPAKEAPFVLAADDIPLARPVTPPKPTSVCGTDLLIGVPIAWGCDLGLGLAIGVVVGLAAGLGGASEFELPPAALVVAGLAGGLSGALVAWYFVCRKYGKTLAEGFSLRPMSWGRQVACAVLGVVSAVLVTLVLGEEDIGDSFMADLLEGPYGLFAVSLLAVTLPPLEEMYYRGFIFPVLREKLGGAAAVLIVTAWFGAAHSIQLAGDWGALAVVGAMGLIWTILRHVSNSLWPSIITHWTYNVALVAQSALSETID